MVELLAPAGSLEKLKVALLYGADACFIGGREFSLRARASNFTIDEIKAACMFAHELGKKVYVTTNIIPHEDDLINLKEYLIELEKAKVDAIITASFAVLTTAKKYTNLEIHISTQQSILNYESANFFYKEGAKRVVLGRELSVNEIKKIKENTKADIEVFIHGGMCSSISGRCVLSNNMTDRDANRGGCAHSCRWNYDLYDNNKNKLNNDTYFQIASKDLQSIKFIKKLINANVDSLKIEGRMKSIYYIATVCKVYRELIDDCYNNKKINYNKYVNEIKKCENRFTSHGFLNGKLTINEQLYNQRSEIPTKEFVGIVLSYDFNTKFVTIEQRNYFKKGDILEFFGPKMKNKKFKINKFYDSEFNLIDVARHPKQIIKFKVDFPVDDYAMLRLVK